MNGANTLHDDRVNCKLHVTRAWVFRISSTCSAISTSLLLVLFFYCLLLYSLVLFSCLQFQYHIFSFSLTFILCVLTSFVIFMSPPTAVALLCVSWSGLSEYVRMDQLAELGWAACFGVFRQFSDSSHFYAAVPFLRSLAPLTFTNLLWH